VLTPICSSFELCLPLFTAVAFGSSMNKAKPVDLEGVPEVIVQFCDVSEDIKEVVVQNAKLAWLNKSKSDTNRKQHSSKEEEQHKQQWDKQAECTTHRGASIS
jgi:hypothetical protein